MIVIKSLNRFYIEFIDINNRHGIVALDNVILTQHSNTDTISITILNRQDDLYYEVKGNLSHLFNAIITLSTNADMMKI